MWQTFRRTNVIRNLAYIECVFSKFQKYFYEEDCNNSERKFGHLKLVPNYQEAELTYLRLRFIFRPFPSPNTFSDLSLKLVVAGSKVCPKAVCNYVRRYIYI